MEPDQNSLFKQFVRIFFRLFFRLLYHEFAWTYDRVASVVSVGRWKSWTLSALPYLENSVVLELGSGPGHLQVALAGKGIVSFGLDSSRQMAKQARNRLNRNSLPENITLGKAQSLPFASGKFDKVVATFPSEYIIEPNTIAQVWRVLKNDGEIIVIPVAWITSKRMWDRLAAGLFRITGQVPGTDPESGDFGDFDPESYFDKSGFEFSKEIIQLSSSRVLLIRATKILPNINQWELG
jgi:ubiquinone/menaquinone biosynthesis C-methylase UbiE